MSQAHVGYRIPSRGGNNKAGPPYGFPPFQTINLVEKGVIHWLGMLREISKLHSREVDRTPLHLDCFPKVMQDEDHT